MRIHKNVEYGDEARNLCNCNENTGNTRTQALILNEVIRTRILRALNRKAKFWIGMFQIRTFSC